MVNTTKVTVDDLFVKPKYRYIAHTFKQIKGAYKPICSGCGLMLLRNKLTQKAVKRGCLHDY